MMIQTNQFDDGLKFFRKHNPTQKFDVGFCEACEQKSIFNKKDDESGWECTNFKCRNKARDIKAKRELREMWKEERAKIRKKVKEEIKEMRKNK